jgi:hypothetical protein
LGDHRSSAALPTQRRGEGDFSAAEERRLDRGVGTAQLGDATTGYSQCLANLGIREALGAEVSDRLPADLREPGDSALVLGK